MIIVAKTSRRWDGWVKWDIWRNGWSVWYKTPLFIGVERGVASVSSVFPKLSNFSTSTMMCCWTLFSSQFQAGFSSHITSLEIMTFWIFLNYKRDSLQIASYNREDTFFTYFIHLISLFFRHMRITYIFKHLHVVIDGL